MTAWNLGGFAIECALRASPVAPCRLSTHMIPRTGYGLCSEPSPRRGGGGSSEFRNRRATDAFRVLSSHGRFSSQGLHPVSSTTRLDKVTQELRAELEGYETALEVERARLLADVEVKLAPFVTRADMTRSFLRRLEECPSPEPPCFSSDRPMPTPSEMPPSSDRLSETLPESTPVPRERSAVPSVRSGGRAEAPEWAAIAKTLSELRVFTSADVVQAAAAAGLVITRKQGLRKLQTWEEKGFTAKESSGGVPGRFRLTGAGHERYDIGQTQQKMRLVTP